MSDGGPGPGHDRGSRTGAGAQGPTLRRFVTVGSAWALGGTAATLAAGLVVNLLAARLLVPAAFGTFVLVLSLAQVLGVVSELGLPPVVGRELARSRAARGAEHGDPERGARWFRAAAGVVTAAGVGVGLVAWAGIGLAGRVVFPDVAGLTGVAWLLGALVLARAYERLFPEAYRGLHDIRSATVFGTAWTQVLAGSVFVVVWLAAGAADLWLLLAVYGAAGLLGGAIAWWRLRRAIPAVTAAPGTVRRMVGESWPVLGHRVLHTVIQVADLWIVGAVVGGEATARYGAALRVVALVSVPLLIVNQVVPPLVATMTASGERQRLERTLRVTATLAGVPAVVVLVVLVAAGGPVLGLFGAFYRDGAPLLAILAIGQFANVWGGSCGVTLVQGGQQRVLVGITAAAAGVLVGAGVVGGLAVGAVGVAIAASLSVVVQNAAMVVACRRRLGIDPRVDPRALGLLRREAAAVLRDRSGRTRTPR